MTPASTQARVLPILLFAAIMLAGSRSADAQVVGYAIAGPAVYSGFFGSGFALHASGGAELLVRGRAGAGGEIGVIGNAGSALLVTSFNGVVHFPMGTSGTSSPYVTGGYSRFSSGEGTFHAWNAGVGVDFWRNNHAGLRVEARDHVRQDSRGAVHYFSIRVGVALK